jgi:hypothetical protein
LDKQVTENVQAPSTITVTQTTDPVEPVEPTDPVEPVEPTEPTDPVEPTEPVVVEPVVVPEVPAAPLTDDGSAGLVIETVTVIDADGTEVQEQRIVGEDDDEITDEQV